MPRTNINGTPGSPETRRAREVVAAFDSVPVDFLGSERGWRYGGGRDLSRLVEQARAEAGTMGRR